LLAPGAVEKVVHHFLARPDWDLLYGRANYIGQEGRVLGAYPTAPYTFRRLVEVNCLCQPAVFWRASLAGKVGTFDERLHCAIDYDYWLRAAQAGGRFAYVDDLLAYSRLHPQAKTLTCRLQAYQEGITVCARHAGTVPRGHFLGYWRERIGQRWLVTWICANLHRWSKT
jgi:hypothetical protein